MKQWRGLEAGHGGRPVSLYLFDVRILLVGVLLLIFVRTACAPAQPTEQVPLTPTPTPTPVATPDAEATAL